MNHIADRDDQSSDINSIQSEDEPLALPQGIQELQLGNGALQEGVAGPLKITTDQEKPDDNPAVDSLQPQSADRPSRPSDAGSTRSLPAASISPIEPPTRPMHQPRSESTSNIAPPSPAPSSQNMPHDTEISAEARRRRQRQTNTESTQATTRSSNRLSGFLNHLIRRDNAPSSSGLSRNAIQEDRSNSPAPEPSTAQTMSRAASPIPRPATPPPELPPPSLRELGLSLSVVTSNLSPSHFSTPPTSGAFLAPHYLLLCHAQGLDVLPLLSPPAPQPYALVRRVAFKHVVVMEQRGVLVAIAGRRDGVRVYALEEVKRAVEWRIDMEVKRERDRSKRDNLKKIALNSFTPGDGSGESRFSTDKKRKQSMSTPPPGPDAKNQVVRKSSHPDMPSSSSSFATQPLIPRTPTIKRPKRPATSPNVVPPPPIDEPPPYSSPEHVPVDLDPSPSTSLALPVDPGRSRSMSVTEVLTAGSISRRTEGAGIGQDSKVDLMESSDDEAINVVAAGASGSQALDERTSAAPPPADETVSRGSHSRTTSTLSARVAQRPANLDLSLARSPTITAPEPSPAPTLMTLRETLSYVGHEPNAHPGTPINEVDDDEDEVDGHVSLTQMLMESRIPDLPPPGTIRDQEAILLASTSASGDAASNAAPSNSSSLSNQRSVEPVGSTPTTPSRRRRWSVMVNNALTGSSSVPVPPIPPIPSSSSTNDRRRMLSRSQSFRSISEGSERARSQSRPASRAASTNAPRTSSPRPITPPPLPDPSIMTTSSTSRSRFIPRIISNAFNARRSEDRTSSNQRGASDADLPKRSSSATAPNQPAPPPKLEYVKLPGTKGALTVKAVETAKKSFLAILCGDNGEKVELFAGTYRTALGLSRTFILPDSPRSLELQLQGDDLVEVFLVFSQNVFGLEPATVRVREVRIGRAERRAARRRARETRTDDPATANDSEQPAPDEDATNVNVSIGVSVAVGSTVVATGTPPQAGAGAPDALIAAEHPSQRATSDGPATDSLGVEPATPADPSTSGGSVGRGDDFLALATAQMGPYTTFQQLSFAPRFPLASIADDYVIPPTYSDFIDYRVAYEPETENGQDLAQIQFSPPGLPVPMPTAPSKWFYRDPKNVIHGPWKASLMQAWYKDGLLPPDLPVRREEETEFVLLKDLRLQCIDPTHPFRSAPPLSHMVDLTAASPMTEPHKPLLKPISLLAQPRHFGPPALFFSTRGGHSTSIVDARGRSVLKGRFVWSAEEKDEDSPKASSSSGRMGDVRRLEAFDVKGDRSVLVAMRQGGLEAVDLSDALLKPGDESRTSIPQYDASESSNNRRGPFVWKIGTPVSTSTSSSSSTVLASKSKGMLSPMAKRSGSISVSKSPSSKTEFNSNSIDVEAEVQDEVLFLGRSGDHIYICERNNGAFRILKLCPEL